MLIIYCDTFFDFLLRIIKNTSASMFSKSKVRSMRPNWSVKVRMRLVRRKMALARGRRGLRRSRKARRMKSRPLMNMRAARMR